VGPTGDDAKLKKALRACWTARGVQGPWWSKSELAAGAPTRESSELRNHSYGAATLAGHRAIGCVVHLVREDAGDDWCDLCLPTGMLDLLFEINYPIVPNFNPWRREVDRYLLDVAGDVFAQVGFECALIGEEVSGYANVQSLTRADFERLLVLVPEATHRGRFPDVASHPVTDGLVALWASCR